MLDTDHRSSRETTSEPSTGQPGTRVSGPRPDEGTATSSRKRHGFRPHEKLHHPAEFRRVKETGRRRRSPHFTVNFAPNGLPHHRLGQVVQKRFWNAAGRNRIKRCVREWFRLHRDLISAPPKDIVVIARPGAEQLSSRELFSELQGVLSREGGRTS